MSDVNSDPSEPSAKSIVVLGSSGGNLRSHGGDDPARLLADVVKQADAAGFSITAAQFVSADASMDSAACDTPARLWSVQEGVPYVTMSGTLSEVNAAARGRSDAQAPRG